VILFRDLVLEIKASDVVRAGNQAIPASYATPEVLDNNAIIPTIGGFRRTDSYTRGIFAVHAGHGYQFDSGVGILAPTHGQYSVPVNFPSLSLLFGRAMGNVILLPAGDRTGLATSAFV
jgi:hypothetical protein